MTAPESTTTDPGNNGIVKAIGASTAPVMKSLTLSRLAGVTNKPATSTLAVALKYTPPEARIQTLPFDRKAPLMNTGIPGEQL